MQINGEGTCAATPTGDTTACASEAAPRMAFEVTNKQQEWEQE